MATAIPEAPQGGKMSTDHLGITDEIINDLVTLGREVEGDPAQRRRRIEEIQRRLREVAFGVSSVVQEGLDDIGVEEERLRQAEEIAQRALRLLGPERESDDEPPPAPQGWNGEEGENHPPTPPVPPEEPQNDDDTVVVPAPTPHVVDVRHWSMLQWLLAFAGLVVGLIVASATAGFDHLQGFGHAVFTTAWFGACAGLGFFSGGWIGSVIDAHRNA